MTSFVILKTFHLIPIPARTPLAKKILTACFANPLRLSIRYIARRWAICRWPLSCQFQPPERRTAWSQVSKRRQRVLTTSCVVSHRLWFVPRGSQINSEVSFAGRRCGQLANPATRFVHKRRCFCCGCCDVDPSSCCCPIGCCCAYWWWTKGKKSTWQDVDVDWRRLLVDAAAARRTIALGQRFLYTWFKQSSPSFIN